MDRRTWRMVGLAAAVAAGLLGRTFAQDGKPTTVKEIMTKLNKKGGLCPTLGTELKGDAPPWTEIQGQTREFSQLVEALGKMRPPAGDKASWERLTRDYAKNAKELDAASQRKDKAAALAAHKKVATACAACHDVHRP